MSYIPMGQGEPASTPEPVYIRPGRAEPPIVWALVVLPLPQLWQFFQPHSLELVPTLIIAAITGGLGVFLATADQLALAARHHLRTTSPWLALLPILYLGVRGSRRFDEAGRGMTPFWVHAAIVAVVAFLLVWGPEGILALLL